MKIIGGKNIKGQQENICQGGFHPKDEIPPDKLEFAAIQLHVCVYIDILNRKEMFIMNRNYHLMTIETLNLEGDYML